MSILIKGIEMPKSCLECLKTGWQYVFECNLNDIEDDKRLITCPLVETPPHGRLIDADKFERIKYEIPIKPANYSRGFDEGVKFVQKLILEAPTIIPADKEEIDGN